jgi:hypothetical protein
MEGTNTRLDGSYSLVLPSGTYRVRACPSCNNFNYFDEWYDGTSDWEEATPVSAIVPDDTPGVNFTLALKTWTVSLVPGWNDVCHIGPAEPADEVLDPLGSAVAIVYRARPGQGFDRWIPGRPDISTINTVEAYDQLIILMTSGSVWEQEIAEPRPASVVLVPGWNSICYAGLENDPDVATAGIAGKFAAIYGFSNPEQVWQRYFPGRPDISNLASLQTYDSIFLAATESAEWVFDAPGPPPEPMPLELCAPVIPATYNGVVTIDGQPAPDGTTITAEEFGITWAVATTSGGRYVFEVPMVMPVVPPCFGGGTLTFQADGASCQESAQWAAGPQDLNLDCGQTLVGDADGDGDVDAVDAMFILQYVVGLRAGNDQCPAPLGEVCLPLSDADCDDDVDAVDALFVLQYVVGLRPELCVSPGP